MTAKTARLAAWGVLVGLVVIGAAIIVINMGNKTEHIPTEIVSRNVKLNPTPNALRTSTTTLVSINAVDGSGEPIDAWSNASLDVWLVRSDLTYASHIRSTTTGATSSFVVPLHPTQPGSYKLVAGGVNEETITIGGTNVRVTGAAEDVAPEEQSAGREEYKVVMSTIPDSNALRINESVSLTFSVSRTDTAVPLTETDGARGSLVAFHENGTLFLRGQASPIAYLPSNSIAAFSLSFVEPGRYRIFFEFETGGRSFMEARWIEVKGAE